MSVPLPSPFLSPVFSPFSTSPDDYDHNLPPEHSGSPSRKRDRARSFVKSLGSPFASPHPSPAYFPPETGSPPSPLISLSPELESSPSLLRKRGSVNSVRSFMKNTSSPFSSPSPSSSPFPSPDLSGLSPNPNRSSPEIDPSASPSRKRERVRSFVKSIRRTSSQLFKKDKKDGDVTPKKSHPTISTLVSDTLSVSTAPTTPNILRRFSHSTHSKHSSTTSVTTMESDLSASYLEVKVGEGGCIHSPIIEVATPISPAVVQPLDPVPMSPLKETGNEEDTPPETESENPDPLLFPLPPSPISTPSPIMDPVDPVQPPENPQEIDAFFHDDEHSSSGDSTVSSSSGRPQPPATTDIALTTSSPDRTAQPSPAPPPPSASAPGPDSDEDEEEMPDLYIPALIAPTMFLPIPNVRFSYFFKPVLTWWLSKGVLSYPHLYS